MSDIIWVKRDRKLFGAFPYDKDGIIDFSELPFDKPMRAEFFQPADPQIKRLYWAIVSRVARGMGKDKEYVDNLLKVAAGHCDVFFTERYGQIRVPKSIADRKCDAQDFRRYFDAAIPLIESELEISRSVFADLLREKAKEERR